MHTRKISRSIIARDGTRISWHTHVPGGPDAPDEGTLAARPILMLTNGIGTSENFWRHLIHLFCHEYRVVHWDYRGHGASDVATGGDYAMATHADDLARVTEAAIGEGTSPVVPVQVGFSMGVVVVLELCRARPDLARALVLVGGPADAPFSTVFPLRLPGAMPALRVVLEALKPLVRPLSPAVDALFNTPFAYPVGRAMGLLRRRAPRAEVQVFIDSLTRMDPRAFWDTLCELMRAHASDVLPQIRVPVLIVAASHDLFVPHAQIEQLARGLAGKHRTVIEDSGHAVLIENGPDVAAATRLFLRGIEQPTT
ncbi:MAG: alpha/beta hydrolase [Deltaproteobacteria bacterium]